MPVNDTTAFEAPDATHSDFRLRTVADVAELLGCSTQSVYRYVYNNGLPTVRLGGGVRIRERDLLAWLDANTVTRGAAA